MSDPNAYPARLAKLTALLEGIPSVAASQGGDEPEPQTLAYALVEIEESCRGFITHLDALVAAEGEQALAELEDLREELRHVLYHLRDSRYLSVVDPLVDQGQNEREAREARARRKRT